MRNEWMTVAEAATLLGMKPQNVRNLIVKRGKNGKPDKRGPLEGMELPSPAGGRISLWLVSRASVAAYQQQRAARGYQTGPKLGHAPYRYKQPRAGQHTAGGAGDAGNTGDQDADSDAASAK